MRNLTPTRKARLPAPKLEEFLQRKAAEPARFYEKEGVRLGRKAKPAGDLTASKETDVTHRFEQATKIATQIQHSRGGEGDEELGLHSGKVRFRALKSVSSI